MQIIMGDKYMKSTVLELKRGYIYQGCLTVIVIGKQEYLTALFDKRK